MRDEFWREPRFTFEERRQQYLTYCAAQSPGGRIGFFSQIARLELRQPVDEGPIREALAFVDSRKDCADFTIGGLLRVIYRYDQSPNIAKDLIADIETCLLGFKYWWDEPGDNRRCYHTENHQILFHSDELLLGQRLRDRTFTNDGRDGRAHMAHGLRLTRRWLDHRARFGYSEWLSNCYFEEDLLALLNLYDFAEDEGVRHQAKAQIDILLFEMALHTYRGIFGATHGRTYPRLIKGARGEATASTTKLIFGMGHFNDPSALGAVSLAASSYRCPPILQKIAADLDKPMLFRERHSLNLEDAPAFGIAYDSLEDGGLFWSVQDCMCPAVLPLADYMAVLQGVYVYDDSQAIYDRAFAWQIEEHGEVVDLDVDRHALTEVHIQTYRTPDYLLSCAQDYRAGKPGYQQHIWQSTLDLDAVVFTNHPGSDDETSRPNYWAGNGVMPRAAQHENVLVCIYHLPPRDGFPFSHAYFPSEAFDEVVECFPWIFGRKGDGYVALFSQHPWHWVGAGETSGTDLRVDATDNIWLVEMGRQRSDECQEGWDSFDAFVSAVASSFVSCEGLSVRFVSPSQGEVRFGWQEPLMVRGHQVALRSDLRYDNPYCRCLAPRGSSPENGQATDGMAFTIQRGDDALDIDLQRLTPPH